MTGFKGDDLLKRKFQNICHSSVIHIIGVI